MSDIYSIIEEQKTLFNKLKRIIDIYEKKDGKTRGFAQTLLEDLELHSKKFNEFHNQLSGLVRDNSINTKDIPYFSNEVDLKFEDLYYSFKPQLLDFINETSNLNTPGFHSTFAAPSHSSFTTQARLPKI